MTWSLVAFEPLLEPEFPGVSNGYEFRLVNPWDYGDRDLAPGTDFVKVVLDG